MSFKCNEPACKRKACFNIKGNPPIFCGPHKKNGMVNINKLCNICYNITPNYNLEGLKAIYCKDCKTDDMIDVKNLKCIECKITRPSFNKPGLPARYCEGCKDNDMINVISKMCEICNEVQPSYNKPGLPARYCEKCKDDDMIDVKHYKCIECKIIRPLFNLPGLPARYCEKCKDDDMIDVINPKCIKCNKVRSNYNKPGLTSEYCKDCKLDDMIDVKHQKCIECKITRPSFNKPGLPARYCEGCKDNDMINVISKMCEICNEVQPSYNKPGLPARYCEGCKDGDMINVNANTCIECNEIRISNPNYNNHCLRCFIYKFPDNKISRNFKVKERHVQDFLEEEFPTEFIYDKPIDQGCSKKRPDAFKECGTHTLIIEVDEYQHRNYEEICENRRMMEIYGDTANRPIVFIRFNPDGYINENNDKIESSFNMHKTRDVPIIKNPIEWQDRLDKLRKTIEHHIDTIPEKAVTIEKLFYDKN
jgi:EsV-1-7 cysteine-rich motif